MKNKLILLLLSIALCISACSSYKKPELKELTSLKVNVKKKFTKLNGTITFFNPNDETIRLHELYFDAFFNGNDVGSYTKKTDALISGQGEISIPFYLEVNNEQYNSATDEIEFVIKGYINGKIKDEEISLSFDETNLIKTNGKYVDDEDSEKTKQELKQEKKEQKKLEKEQKKLEEIKRKASKEIES